MHTHYLDSLFAPKSVAVIGASERAGSIGRVIMENLIGGGYGGAIYPVNPKRNSVFGLPAYRSIEDAGPVDLAVITTPADTVPGIIEACGRHGTQAALLISNGFGGRGPVGRGESALLRETLHHAKTYGVRLLGPDCLGIMRPGLKLNLAYSPSSAQPGNVALVSQSGALCNAVLDWAASNDVGFSSVITLGRAADVKFGGALDYLAWDYQTQSILIYLEGIYDPHLFMSALRAAARVKPVIVCKAGRDPAGYAAAVTHTGAMVGTDDVFDAALTRAGAVRVRTFTELFSAARCLTSRHRPFGSRLAVVTNGGGPGIVAADWMAQVGLAAPELSAATAEKLNSGLSTKWSHGNPVDIGAGAIPADYRTALSACLEDPVVDGALVILSPQVCIDAGEAAQTVVETAGRFAKPVVACWMGGDRVKAGREILTRSHIPTFRTPEPAVDAFSHIAAHYRSQRLLMQVPGPMSEQKAPDVEGARLLIEDVLVEKRRVLTEMESKALLAAFRIPVANTVVARTPAEAILIAEQIRFPVAMKVNSSSVTHKSDVGGVRLGINNAQEVRAAFHDIQAQLAKHAPGAAFDGVSIQPMSDKPNGRELIVGIVSDPVFGPVVTFGSGGVAVEVMNDRAVALPPLNRYLALDLIDRTKAARMLGTFRNMPPVQMDALENVLLRVSEIACELPWVKELDINPLVVDEHGAIAVDARVVVDYAPLDVGHRYAHMAIYPYPAHLVEHILLPDGTPITLRPVRPEDAEMLQNFMHGLSEQSKYFRFFNTLAELSPHDLVRMTQIDYQREMAIFAVTKVDGREVEMGAARYAINPDGESCEFALIVSDQWQNRGLGSRLMLKLMDVARSRGLKVIEGEVLAQNQNMLKLMTILGFEVLPSEDDPAVKRVVRSL